MDQLKLPREKVCHNSKDKVEASQKELCVSFVIHYLSPMVLLLTQDRIYVLDHLVTVLI